MHLIPKKIWYHTCDYTQSHTKIKQTIPMSCFLQETMPMQKLSKVEKERLHSSSIAFAQWHHGILESLIRVHTFFS
jgi:hypothetical protein